VLAGANAVVQAEAAEHDPMQISPLDDAGAAPEHVQIEIEAEAGDVVGEGEPVVAAAPAPAAGAEPALAPDAVYEPAFAPAAAAPVPAPAAVAAPAFAPAAVAAPGPGPAPEALAAPAPEFAPAPAPEAVPETAAAPQIMNGQQKIRKMNLGAMQVAAAQHEAVRPHLRGSVVDEQRSSTASADDESLIYNQILEGGDDRGKLKKEEVDAKRVDPELKVTSVPALEGLLHTVNNWNDQELVEKLFEEWDEDTDPRAAPLEVVKVCGVTLGKEFIAARLDKEGFGIPIGELPLTTLNQWILPERAETCVFGAK